MAGRSSALSTKTEATAKCQCGKVSNALIVARVGSCKAPCNATIPKKHVYCHPCMVGNHERMVCLTPTRDSYFPLVKECTGCGFDLAVH